MGHPYTTKFLSFICSSNLTGHPVFWSGNPAKSKCSTAIYWSKGMTEEKRKEARQGRKEPVHPLLEYAQEVLQA